MNETFKDPKCKYPHDLLQRGVAGSQFGHSEGRGNTDRRQEDVLGGGFPGGQLFVEGQGEAAVGPGQLPHSGVGGFGDRVYLWTRVRTGVFEVRIRTSVNAARLQRQVFRSGAADVGQRADGQDRGQSEGQETHTQPHPGEKYKLNFTPMYSPRVCHEKPIWSP